MAHQLKLIAHQLEIQRWSFLYLFLYPPNSTQFQRSLNFLHRHWICSFWCWNRFNWIIMENCLCPRVMASLNLNAIYWHLVVNNHFFNEIVFSTYNLLFLLFVWKSSYSEIFIKLFTVLNESKACRHKFNLSSVCSNWEKNKAKHKFYVKNPLIYLRFFITILVWLFSYLICPIWICPISTNSFFIKSIFLINNDHVPIKLFSARFIAFFYDAYNVYFYRNHWY